MVLKCEVILSASFIHKESGKMFSIDKSIIKEYDEYSEEYKKICGVYETEIGFNRNENKDKFDKCLLEKLVETYKEECRSTVDLLTRIFKEHCKTGAKGFIEFGGWLLRLQDFSGVLFNDLKVNISKK